MPTMAPVTKRFCIINPNGGTLTVRLYANNMTQSGADFLLEDSTSMELDSWKAASGAAGHDEHVVKAVVATLSGATLRWEILVCALSPNANDANIEIQVLQDGAPCQLTKPTSWALTDVPTCQSGHTTAIHGSLTFLFA